MRTLALLTLALLAGCSGSKDTGAPAGGGGDLHGDDTADPGGDDTADPGGDTGDTADSGDTGDDTGEPDDTGDTGGDTGDTGSEALPGFGELTGDCDELDATELGSADPWLFSNVLDLGELEFDQDALSDGGEEVYTDGNLGGSSLHSEVFAYEVLYRCEAATLLKTEGEIAYQDAGGKKTDLLVEIDGVKIGVSVTRAYGWPPEDPYTVEQATALLEDKLADVLLSSANVAAEDAWDKQILSVIAYTPDHAASIEAAWAQLDAAVRADTIVVVTATEGNDEYIY